MQSEKRWNKKENHFINSSKKLKLSLTRFHQNLYFPTKLQAETFIWHIILNGRNTYVII